MFQDRMIPDKEIKLESRLTKVEVTTKTIKDDLKEIKRILWWLIGMMFGLNTTIIGMLAKALDFL